MKLNFTRLIGLSLFCLAFIQVNGQNVNRLYVNIDGTETEINFGIAAFGDQTLEVDANAVLVNDDVDTTTDGCESITNDVTGAVALIDRGSCFFGIKAENGEAAGAVAVVICNSETDPTTGDNIADQTIAPALGNGGEGANTTILTAGISFNDCQTIKMALDAGSTVSIRSEFFCPAIEYGPEVIWGSDGEGAFDGGLNGWSVDKGDGTSLDDNGWFYDSEGRLDRGLFGPGLANTPTTCNGVMLFDSDFYDSQGIGDPADNTTWMLGSGPCPSEAAGVFCEGLLISPVIDMAAAGAEGAELVWSQSVRHFQSEYYVLVSNDGGMSWADTIQINDDLVTNDPTTNDERSIKLCGFDDASEFRFAFWYRGSYYFWAIDDVYIRSTSAEVNLRANNFFSSYPNKVTPASQVDECAFILDVENLGAATATGVNVDVELRSLTTLDVIYEDNQTYPDIGCGVLDENRVFPNRFSGDLDEGDYRITYTVNADSDADLANNQQTFDFSIGGNTFRKLPTPENGRPALVSIGPGAGNENYSIGQYYYIPNGGGFKATSCRLGIEPGGATFNGFIEINLYRWVDLSTPKDHASQPGERVLIGQARRAITSSIPEDYSDMFFALEVPGDPSAEIQLSDDSHYILMAHMQPFSATDPIFNALAASAAPSATDIADPSIYYGGSNLAWTQEFDEFRGGGYMFSNGIQGDEQDRTFTVANNFTVYMPLTIAELGSTSTEDLAVDQTISVFPNPASDRMFIDINTANKVTDVSIELLNIQGQAVLNQNYDFYNGRIELDINSVPAGVYALNVRTENGLISKKVVIQ